MPQVPCPPEALSADSEKELELMTLIVSIQHEGKIVLAADGMAYTPASQNANVPYRKNKLFPVKGTDWVLGFAGWGGIASFHKRLEAEVDLDRIPHFDSHLEVGGFEYFNALRRISEEQGKNMPPSPTLLAGFDINGKPLVISAVLPSGACYDAHEITAFGAQNSTALWILNTLLSCCGSLEDVKRLAYFTISQVAKHELQVGSLEAGYAISLCVLEPGKPIHSEQENGSALNGWLGEWQRKFQDSFKTSIKNVI
jgi:hypothetical protein